MNAKRASGVDRQARVVPASPSRRRWCVGACAAASLAWLSIPIAAARYPSRPVRFMVGQGPGGPSDLVARLIAKEFEERWKETVIVENRVGATGTIASRMVARAAPDGYTLLVTSNSPFAAAALAPEIAGYDPLSAFAPVGRFARGGYVLAVRSGLGVATLREFATLARARAESVSVSTVGSGSNSARALALFQRAADVQFINVPYNGGALALEAVVAGHVDATFCELALARPFAASGAVRILAAVSRQRLAFAPNLPTFVELGFAGVITDGWYGIVAPAETPAALIDELVATLHSAIADADVRQRFAALGLDTIVETPDEFRAAIAFEIEQARLLA